MPTTATLGTVRLRVRIQYPTTSFPAILPCGTAQDGEVEDYRINITSAGGSSASIEDAILEGITLFPNPASDVLNINLNSNLQRADVSLVDITGKVVYTNSYKNVNELQINTSDFATGMYQVVIATELGTTVKRVVKK